MIDPVAPPAMKISDLLLYLSTLQLAHGDLEVTYTDNFTVADVTQIEIRRSDGAPPFVVLK